MNDDYWTRMDTLVFAGSGASDFLTTNEDPVIRNTSFEETTPNSKAQEMYLDMFEKAAEKRKKE